MTELSRARSWRRVLARALNKWGTQGAAHLVMLVTSFLCLAPFVWMFFGSFKTFRDLTRRPPTLLPERWIVDNYVRVWTNQEFPRALMNTVVVCVTTTIAVVLVSTLAGFVFAKYRFPGKETLFMALLASMMIPASVTLVPFYVLVVRLGMNDSLAAITVPSLISVFGIFLLRQSLEVLPNALLDAARIDGALEIWIFRQVVVPLSKAAMTALAMLYFLGKWDEYMWPLVVLRSNSRQTLAVMLAQFRNMFYDEYGVHITAAMMTVVPVMILYALASRTFIRGMVMAGIKG